MLCRFAWLGVAALMALAPLIAQADEATSPPPIAGTETEGLRLALPKDMRLAADQYQPAFRLIEFLPTGQSLTQWTDMVTVLIMPRPPGMTLDSLMERFTAAFFRGCAVEAIVAPPKRFGDAGYPVGLHLARCGRSLRFGQGEAFVAKTIEGASAYFQVQRAWRLSAAARSEDLPVTPEMIVDALDLLDTAQLCARRGPDGAC